MALKTIYIARHGYRANWIVGATVPDPPTGINGDVQLAKHGLRQAHELGRYLLSLDEQPELIFSSPFFRCLETSEPIAEFLEVPVYIERGFGEWYRPDRPEIPIPASNETLEKFFQDKVRVDWESCAAPSEKGETEEELYKRCNDVLDKFIRKIEEDFPNVETIMIITHGATKIALGLNLLGRPNARCTVAEGSKEYLRCGSCSLDKFQVQQPEHDKNVATSNDEDDDELVTTPPLERDWVCTMNGNTEFLSRGEEMNWGFHLNVEAGSDADIRSRINTGPSDKETVYVSVDIPSGSYKEKFQLNSKSQMQFSGLNKDEPLVVINNQLYIGNWQKLVGTELAFPSAATLKKKNSLNPDEEEPRVEVSDLMLADDFSDEFDEVKQEETSENQLESEEEEDDDEEDSEKNKQNKKPVTAQKVYRIKDRLVLQNVELM